MHFNFDIVLCVACRRRDRVFLAANAKKNDISYYFCSVRTTEGFNVLIITVKRRFDRADFKCMIRSV